MLNIKLILAVTLLLATTVQAETCASRGQRLEFRQLTHEQRLGYINAIKQLQKRTANGNSKYDQMMRDHVAVTTYAHGVPRFLSWHRAFLRDYEKNLLAAGSPVLLPYWDWAYDSQAPHLSIIFDKEYLGGNGAGPNNCVPNGAFTDWKPQNQRGCLARHYDAGDRVNPLWGPEALQTLFGTDDYDTFRQRIEGPHGNVHNGVGDVFSTMEAASDPLFYLHHGFVDKLWADWQKGNANRLRSYTGVNDNGVPVSLSDDVGFGYRASDVLDTNNLCYTYRDFTGDSAPVTPPTDTTTPGTNTTAPADNSTTTPPLGTNTTLPGTNTTSPSTNTTLPGTNTTLPGTNTTLPGTNTTLPGTNTTSPSGTLPSNDTRPVNGSTPGNITLPGNVTVPGNVNISVPGVITLPANSTGTSTGTGNTGTGNTGTGNTGTGNTGTGTGNTGTGSNTPSNNDYGNIINIRPPVPLPEEWCRRNGVNINLVRRLETVAKTTVDAFNKVPGYISRAALVNHRVALGKLAARGQRFYGYVGNKRIHFQQTGSVDAAASVRSATAAVAGQVRNQVPFTFPSVVKKIFANTPSVPRFPPSSAPRTNPITLKPTPLRPTYAGAKVPQNKTYGTEEVSYAGDGAAGDVAGAAGTGDVAGGAGAGAGDAGAAGDDANGYGDKEGEAEKCGGEETYGDETPTTNTTTYTPTPAPVANDTYGDKATASYAPTPAPAANDTYGSATPANGY